MPFSLIYDTREAVPEVIQDHITEKDGKFIFEGEPVSVVTTTNGKLKTLRADLDAKTARLSRYAKLEELGDEADIDELLSLREAKKAGKPLSVDEKAEYDRQIAKLTAKQADELKSRESSLTAAQSELKQFKLNVPLRDAALKGGVLPEDIDVAMLETSSRWRLGEDGKKIEFLDGDGDVDSSVTPEKFYKEMYSKLRPKFYAASNAGGSGAEHTTRGNGGSKTITRQSFEALNQSDRMKVSKEGIKVVD